MVIEVLKTIVPTLYSRFKAKVCYKIGKVPSSQALSAGWKRNGQTGENKDVDIIDVAGENNYSLLDTHFLK